MTMKSNSHRIRMSHLRRLERLFDRRDNIMHILKVYYRGIELPPPSVVAGTLNHLRRRPHVSPRTVRRDYVALGFCRGE